MYFFYTGAEIIEGQKHLVTAGELAIAQWLGKK